MDAEVAINGEDLSSLSGDEEEEEEGMGNLSCQGYFQGQDLTNICLAVWRLPHLPVAK